MKTRACRCKVKNIVDPDRTSSDKTADSASVVKSSDNGETQLLNHTK